MAVLTPVEDRVSTYPGRVKMTPVSGQTNVYDMVRADDPVQEGTPLNKALLDQKAYTLTRDVTVYVSLSGDDASGDGSSAAPFASIQAAVNALPKCLGGYTARIDITAGTYNERVTVDGFYGGDLIIGEAGRTVVVRGFSIDNSSTVTLNIPNLTWVSGFSGTILRLGNGSTVILGSSMTVRCENSTEVGVGVTYSSRLVGGTLTVMNCTQTAIRATYGANVALATITGSGNTNMGMLAELGAIISYGTSNLTSTNGSASRTGGRILTGSGSELAGASLV